MAGIDNDGFTTRYRDDLVAELNARFKQAHGDQFDVSPEGPDGQQIGIMADYLATAWEMGEGAYNAYNPNATEGVALDNIVYLNGITRIQDRNTVVACQLGGVTNTVVPAGSIVATDDGVELETNVELIIPGLVNATELEGGPVDIAAGTVTKVVTTIAGWTTVTNPSPGVTGIVRETDVALRARRERSIIRTGTSTAEAIYNAVADLNLEFIAVVENDTAVVVDGVPPHSFLTLVEGGVDRDIAERIYQNKTAGIRAFGDTEIIINDSEGYPHTIGISRPTSKTIHVKVQVTVPPGTSVHGPEIVQEAIVDFINSLPISQDVIWANLFVPATIVSETIINSIVIGVNGVDYNMDNIPVLISEKAGTTKLQVDVEVL